jgi:isopenicillin-N N-acyltransferase like protein
VYFLKETKELKVIKCQGTDYEIGQQYGEACREDFRRSVENIYIAYQKYQISKEQIIADVHKFIPLVQNFDSQAVEFIRGIASGAYISIEEAMVIRAANELAFYNNLPSGMSLGLCTSFSATGMAVKSGKTLIGQNLDWVEGTPIALIWMKRNDGIEQLCLSSAGGLEFGLNSMGIGICVNRIWPPQNTPHQLNIPMGCYLPKVMRQRTIGDALGVLCQAAKGMQYYNLASSEGDIIGLESTVDDYNVLQPERDILVHTNHYLTERFKKGDLTGQNEPDTYFRIQRIRRLMELNYGQLTPEIMMDILADHNDYPNSVCGHVDETSPLPHWETQASIIMVPAEGTMYVAYGNPCQNGFVEYNLKKMFYE